MTTRKPLGEPDALIIVDHGSRLASANEMLEDVGVMLRGMQPLPVYAAHMELAEPSIATAFASAVAQGARFIFVFPYFLSPGRHSQNDIPSLVAKAAEPFPHISWHVSGPIGVSELLGRLIVDRVRHCQRQSFDATACPLCPITHCTHAGVTG